MNPSSIAWRIEYKWNGTYRSPSAVASLRPNSSRVLAFGVAVNAKNEPLERQLDAANADVAAAQERANALAAQIDANRGGQKWIDMKYQIGVLARALGRVPRETEAA